MTIRFVQQWNGYSPDTIVTLAGAEETRLIGLGYAVTDLDGPGNTPLPVTSTTNLTGGLEKVEAGGVGLYQALGRSVKNFIGTRVWCGFHMTPGGVAQSGSGNTWSVMYALPSEFVGVRLIFQNTLAVDITNVTGCVSAGGDASSVVNTAGTFTNVTFGGAATGTIPAGTANAPSILVSDWAAVGSVPRVDGGTYPLVFARCFTPLENANVPYAGPGSGTNSWATRADAWCARWTPGDYVTTPAGMPSTTNPYGSPIAGIQYLSKSGAVLSIAVFGDSLTATVGTVTLSMDGWVNRLTPLLGNWASYANYGQPGQTSTQYLSKAEIVLPALKPSIAIYSIFSPNDGLPTAATKSGQMFRAMKFIEMCRANDVVPVLATGVPRATTSGNTASFYTNAQDDVRKEVNAFAKSLGVTVIDFAQAMSNQNNMGTASLWSSSSILFDGVHDNDAGQDIRAATAVAALSKIKP